VRRSAALRELGATGWSGAFGLADEWAAAELAVAEPVAVALRLRITAWWTRRSIIAAATTSSPKVSPQAEKGFQARAFVAPRIRART